MGTRSVTHVYDESGALIISMYRQYDGYPTGMGQDLKDFLDGIVIVNGLMLGDTRRTANGMGCLAAQIVANFKTEPGEFYLYPPDPELDAGQEFEYFISLRHDKLWLRVIGNEGSVIYNGAIEDCVMSDLER